MLHALGDSVRTAKIKEKPPRRQVSLTPMINVYSPRKAKLMMFLMSFVSKSSLLDSFLCKLNDCLLMKKEILVYPNLLSFAFHASVDTTGYPT